MASPGTGFKEDSLWLGPCLTTNGELETKKSLLRLDFTQTENPAQVHGDFTTSSQRINHGCLDFELQNTACCVCVVCS